MTEIITYTTMPAEGTEIWGRQYIRPWSSHTLCESSTLFNLGNSVGGSGLPGPPVPPALHQTEQLMDHVIFLVETIDFHSDYRFGSYHLTKCNKLVGKYVSITKQFQKVFFSFRFYLKSRSGKNANSFLHIRYLIYV